MSPPNEEKSFEDLDDDDCQIYRTGVIGDELVPKFLPKFEDSPNLGTNSGIHEIWGRICPKIWGQIWGIPKFGDEYVPKFGDKFGEKFVPKSVLKKLGNIYGSMLMNDENKERENEKKGNS